MKILGKIHVSNHAYVSNRRIYKLLAMTIPLSVVLVCVFLPLKEFIRQALVGIMLVWLYMGVLTGFQHLS